jgi:hypothetical protein
MYEDMLENMLEDMAQLLLGGGAVPGCVIG